MNIEDVRKQIRDCTNRLRCVESDLQKDPEVELKKFDDWAVPFQQRLERLRYKYEHARGLVLGYRLSIDRLKSELGLLAEAAKLRRLAALMAKVNGLKAKGKGGKPRRVKRFNPIRLDARRAVDFRYMIEGFENEIKALEKLTANEGLAFRKEEELIIRAIEANERARQQFIESWKRGEELIEELLNKIADLIETEKTMVVEPDVGRLHGMLSDFQKMLASTPAEVVQHAIGR